MAKLSQGAWFPSTSMNSDTSSRRPAKYLRAQSRVPHQTQTDHGNLVAARSGKVLFHRKVRSLRREATRGRRHRAIARRPRPAPGGTNQILNAHLDLVLKLTYQPSNNGLLQLRSLVSREPAPPFCDRSRGRQ